MLLPPTDDQFIVNSQIRYQNQLPPIVQPVLDSNTSPMPVLSSSYETFEKANGIRLNIYQHTYHEDIKRNSIDIIYRSRQDILYQKVQPEVNMLYIQDITLTKGHYIWIKNINKLMCSKQNLYRSTQNAFISSRYKTGHSISEGTARSQYVIHTRGLYLYMYTYINEEFA